MLQFTDTIEQQGVLLNRVKRFIKKREKQAEQILKNKLKHEEKRKEMMA